MNIQVIRTDQLRGNNYVLAAYGENHLYKLVEKRMFCYTWKCCYAECKGYIKTTPRISNFRVTEEEEHKNHPHYTMTIIDLITLMKNYNQSVSFVLDIFLILNMLTKLSLNMLYTYFLFLLYCI